MVEILDNSPKLKVIDTIKDYIKDSKEICFCVGYFFLSGWDLIKHDLPRNAKSDLIKIIIGRELDYPTFTEISKGYKLRTKTMILEDINEIRDISKLEQLYELIKNKIVDFRVFLDGKLHSKLYLFINNPEYLKEGMSFSPGSAIVGSSNFTRPGTLENKELNVSLTDTTKVKFLYNWFNELWEESEEFREELINIIKASGILKKKIPFGKFVSPKTLFKYLSWLWLDGRIEHVEKKDILAEFQLIGVINAVDMISEHNCAIIADSVGLGKSFIGATVIEEYIKGKYPEWDPNFNNYHKLRNVLLILPPSIIPQWEHLLFQSNSFFFGECSADKTSSEKRFITYRIIKKSSGIYKEIGKISLLSLGKFSNMSVDDVYSAKLNEIYDLILIDEAHKFRNRGTNRWTNARALRFKEKDNPNSFRNKFIFLTATPINNTIWDVYNLIKIFSDDNFESFKKRRVHITELFNQYKQIKKKWKENPKEEPNLILKAQEIKEKVFNRVMILRTRKYLMEKFGEGGKIKIAGKELMFKDPLPDKITYESGNSKFTAYWEFLKEIEANFEDLEFSFIKLYSSGYIILSSTEFRENIKDEEEERILVPINVILKFLLAKRLESSIFAFEKTMLKFRSKNNIFYGTLKQFYNKMPQLSNEVFLNELRKFSIECLNIVGKEEILREFEEEIDAEVKRTDPRVRMLFNILDLGGSDFLSLIENEIKKETDFYNYIESHINKESIIQALKTGFIELFNEIKRDKKILDNLKEKLDKIKIKDTSGKPHLVDSFVEDGKRIEIVEYNDPKLEKLKELIYTDLVGKKYIVFTQYRDTAIYIFRILRKWIQNQKKTLVYLFDNDILKLEIVTGGLKMERKDRLIKRFAPYANEAMEFAGKNELMVLISTDSLSEGVNLQDADGVINYDLPWNPMILVQRIGRVNRIGNEKDIFVKNFVPTKEIETIIGILAKISDKIKDITFLVGKEYYIMSGEEEIKIETFGEKIKSLAEAQMSTLEKISFQGDGKFIGDIIKDEDLAKFELINFIHNELRLRKEDFEEIKSLLEKKLPIYTLTDSEDLFRVYFLYRGKTRIDRIILKNSLNKIIQVTSRELINLWDAEEREHDIDFLDLRKKIDKMDEYFEIEIKEKKKGMKVQGGFIANLLNYLRDFRLSKQLTEINVNKEKLNALINYLPMIEMSSQEIGKFKRALIEGGSITEEKNRIKDLIKLINHAYDYLKVNKELERKLTHKVVGWWI
ncbi:MAG: helicase-related protein [Candidatus Helarchaeota archaeon]